MQANVKKEPPPWVPPFSLSGGGTHRGGRGALPPPSYATDKYWMLSDVKSELKWCAIRILMPRNLILSAVR